MDRDTLPRPLFGITSPLVQRTFALTVGIANYGYIPLPIAERYFPQAFHPLLIHNIGVDIALWSVGLLVISGEIKQGVRRFGHLLTIVDYVYRDCSSTIALESTYSRAGDASLQSTGGMCDSGRIDVGWSDHR